MDQCWSKGKVLALGVAIVGSLLACAAHATTYKTPATAYIMRFYPAADSTDTGVYLTDYSVRMTGPMSNEGHVLMVDKSDDTLWDDDPGACGYWDFVIYLDLNYSFWICTHGTPVGTVLIEYYTSEAAADEARYGLWVQHAVDPDWSSKATVGTGIYKRWAVCMTPAGFRHYSHNPDYQCVQPPPFTPVRQICFFESCYTGGYFPLVYGAGLELGYDESMYDADSSWDGLKLFRDMAGLYDGASRRSASTALVNGGDGGNYTTCFTSCRQGDDLVLCPALTADPVWQSEIYRCDVDDEQVLGYDFDCDMMTDYYPWVDVATDPTIPESWYPTIPYGLWEEWTSPTHLRFVVGGVTSAWPYIATLDAGEYQELNHIGCFDTNGWFKADADRVAPNGDTVDDYVMPP